MDAYGQQAAAKSKYPTKMPKGRTDEARLRLARADLVFVGVGVGWEGGEWVCFLLAAALSHSR